MKRTIFKENEMPYGTLEKFGLNQEMIEDLPLSVLNDIYNGFRSPVLPIKVTTDEGEVIKSRSRFALVSRNDDIVDVIFFPELLEADLTNFTEEQKKSLLSGKIIIADVANPNGDLIKSYVQIDNWTNQVLSAPTQVVERNIQTISGHLNLTPSESNSLSKGDVVTYVREDDEPISIGIDLNDSAALRLENGDEKFWRAYGKREWDKYTFGAFGCWVMDDAGNLDYISEDNYTDELWNEQRKHGLKAVHQLGR